MSRRQDIQRKVVTTFQRTVANRVARRLPGQTLLETTGRKSGLPRTTPIGGRRVGDEFWFVSEYGTESQYVRNIQAQPRVRVRLRGRWFTGTAHLLADDDARARLATLPTANSAVVRAFGTGLTTIRVDLDARD
ncbi:nitroreductase [Prauserella marina]|uniref:Deazaflavin-dependent oxidoreductase, nitroreductase family n=1 Tax=Prauserella marina TaxID=530584 RepID=A0A222VNZ3_9PSEU|nr:nitroreductase/quinone reductase family protein [Prauserella marina]ASR35628.1 nitroreductase [Prauserella marina]PWV84507.1 deazaflavin-dependent oxidoreductase (nitroreductase family) [Prauserella marina]SDC20676.1 deazaflavin-dependent oxidoreductase, nitroreductase family [Prauserella marina]